MSRICFFCGENETPDGHNKICDPCYDNAGYILEQHAELFASALSKLAAKNPGSCWRCNQWLNDGERAEGSTCDDCKEQLNTPKL